MIRVLELRSVRGTGGGPEKTILAGAAYGDRAKFTVTVCYIRDRRDQIFEIGGRADASGIHYVELLERHSFDTNVWPALRRLVRELRVDIVHSHDYKTDLLALLLSRYEGVIPLSTAHGWTGHSVRERYLYYPLDKLILRGFPKLIAVSSEIREQLIRFGSKPENVRVVLNGIDPDRFKRNPTRSASERQRLSVARDALVIGSVGRLEPQKRFDLLISAFARLLPAFPTARLVIAGEGSDRARLEQQIRELHLSDVCRLLGHCSDVIGFYHSLDCFVQSSIYEGTPNVVLEAMAMEIPIVATAAGGTAELVRSGVDGLIVSPGDLSALHDSIGQTFGDRGAASTRARSARARVENELSFNARMAAVECIYEELSGMH